MDPKPIDRSEQRDEMLPDIDWSRAPIGTVATTFDAPSGPLAVLSMGDPTKPRVVLVPGVTGSKEDFHFLFPELVESGYYVQSYDLAGQYESWQAGPEHLDPPQEHYDYDLFFDDMVAFLSAGSTPVHLLGYSFAGIIAQLVLVRRPDLVASLTLLSSPPLVGQTFRGVKWIGPFSGVCSPKVIAGLMKWGVVNGLNKVTPGRLKFVRDRFALTRPESHVDIMGLMKKIPDLRADLRKASVPLAVAVGTHDLWSLRQHRRFASSIGATIAVYRTGHSPCETAPYQLSRDLLALFEKALQSR